MNDRGGSVRGREYDEKLGRVKRELRKLRWINHALRSAMAVRALFEERIAYLYKLGDTDERRREIEKLRENIAKLRIEEKMREASELEAVYLVAIGKLSDLDRMIVQDGYIGGKSYRKIGGEIGYSERGIQDRMSKIIGKLADMT